MSSAASGEASTPSLPHRRDVQGLRGLAVLLVVAYHAGRLLPGGFIGVDVFLVLSGYLITSLLLAEARATGTVRLGRFAARRVRRLLPALSVTLVVTLGVAAFVIPVGRYLDATTTTAIAAATVRANISLATVSGYFTPAADLNPLLHTWSLSLEEQFYLLWPALLLLALYAARRRGGSPDRAFLAAAGMVFVLSAGTLAWARLIATDATLASAQWLFYAPHARVWELAAGALLAVLPAASLARSPTWFRPAGVLLILLSTVLITDLTPFPGGFTALPVLGTLLALAPTGAAVGLESRPLVWLGDRSYSWYLWHWPVLTFVRWTTDASPTLLVGAALLSLLPSMASYRWIEQPFRTRARTGRAALRLATASVAVPVAAALMLHSLAGVATTRTEELLPNLGYTEPAVQPVYEPSGPPVATVAIVGDSHAQMLVPALAQRLIADGIRVVNLTNPGCEFLLELDLPTNRCNETRSTVVAELTRIEPDVVVIGGLVSRLVTRTQSGLFEGYLIQSADGTRAGSEDEALELYTQGLESALALLDTLASDVVVVSSVPTFATIPSPTVVQGLRRQIRLEVTPRAEAEALRAGLFDVEAALTRARTSRWLVDPLDVLCDQTVCHQERDGVLLYGDDNHLSEIGSALLADVVMPQIQLALDQRNG